MNEIAKSGFGGEELNEGKEEQEQAGEIAVAESSSSAIEGTAELSAPAIVVYKPKKRSKFRRGCYLFFKRCFDFVEFS